jgi:hypothetical protein
MTRLFITVDYESEMGISAKLVEPTSYGVARKIALPASINSVFSLNRSALRLSGENLFRMLSHHPQIKRALKDALKVDPADVMPVFFEIGTTAAGVPAWETLYNRKANGFLALQARWPISRVAAQRSGARVVRTFAPPLRIMAFLAAWDIDALDEWDGLYAAVRANRAHDFDIQLDVVAGKQALFDHIQETTADDEWVHLQGLPDTSAETLSLIENGHSKGAGPPHIVHFFCHGRVSGGVGSMELATILDNDTRAAGSVVLTVDDLASLRSMSHVWLFALDACSLGRSSEEAESLAHNLVQVGAPAVVGWREPIDAPSASVFCRHFYESLLPNLRACLSAARPMSTVRIEWATAMTRARSVLGGDDPEQLQKWSLPLLYVREAPFEVFMTEVHNDGAVEQIDFLTGVLALPDTPTSICMLIRERIGKLSGGISESRDVVGMA